MTDGRAYFPPPAKYFIASLEAWARSQRLCLQTSAQPWAGAGNAAGATVQPLATSHAKGGDGHRVSPCQRAQARRLPGSVGSWRCRTAAVPPAPRATGSDAALQGWSGFPGLNSADWPGAPRSPPSLPSLLQHPQPTEIGQLGATWQRGTRIKK